MASTTALLTGLSGLTANARKLDVIGNNIANANTPAFKSNRMLFAPTFSRTLSAGTSPSGASGGANPSQVGLGISVAGTQRNFNNGAIATTGVATDLAIEGNGFFIVQRSGQEFYTRAGAFELNSQRDLVTVTGERVQGFAVDDNFNIIEGSRVGLNIPVGALTIAEATERVQFSGNLNAGGELPTQGARVAFDVPFTDFGAATPLTGASLLVNLDDPSNTGNALFPVAGVPFQFSLNGAQKGGKTVPTEALTIDATTTVQNLIDFINNTFGIVPGVLNPDGSTSGAQIDGAGVFSIVGNAGEPNNLTIDNTDIRLSDAAGAPITSPFTLSQSAVADGEGVRTTFVVYDSLGTPVEVDLAFNLESTGATGTVWRYYVDSRDHIDSTNLSLNIGSGTISFDTSGRLSTEAPISVLIGREGTGAVNPLTVSLSMASEGNSVTALTNLSGVSTIAAVFQDGSPLGVLSQFSVGEDGTITGAFTNGLTRTIGQLAVATFTNPEGLVDAGNQLFTIGANSGTPLITTPGQFGAGRMIGGALEQSNVDLGQEFIDLVLTSTGYSAASRIISTTDQLLQQLIALGR
ncbi:MAG: flagellar hook-basal body complex protein [Phycisphaerales bacterium]|nr:flagellar hook-basal body complex protein [Phycisphaerales bacterium]